MSTLKELLAEDRRKAENDALLIRMKRGDNLCHTDLSAFRWAPRPLLSKLAKDRSQTEAKREPAPTRRLTVVDGE